MTAESNITIFQRIQWVANTLFHSFLAIVTFFIFWVILRNNKSSDTLWHIVWSTVAYVPLMAEGIILFSESNSWSPFIRRTNKYYLHGAFLLSSVISVTVGCILIINEKNKFNSKHFKSDHAITGLASWVICLTSVILGLAAAYSQTLKRFVSPVILKLIHNFLGLSAYLIGISSLILGLEKRSFAGFVTEEELTGTKWLLIILVAYSCLEACRSMYHQIKSIVT